MQLITVRIGNGFMTSSWICQLDKYSDGTVKKTYKKVKGLPYFKLMRLPKS